MRLLLTRRQTRLRCRAGNRYTRTCYKLVTIVDHRTYRGVWRGHGDRWVMGESYDSMDIDKGYHALFHYRDAVRMRNLLNPTNIRTAILKIRLTTIDYVLNDYGWLTLHGHQMTLIEVMC